MLKGQITALVLALLTMSASSQAMTTSPNIPLSRAPRACECFPTDVSSKKYLDEGRLFPKGMWRIFTCDFTCTAPDGSTTVITGTQKDQFRFQDDGRHFVCRGYQMKFVETPMDSSRHGFFTIYRTEPFNAANSEIPELLEWSQQSCH